MKTVKFFLNLARLSTLVGVGATALQGQNLLLNGSFENGAVVSGNTTDIDSWTRAGNQIGYISDGTFAVRPGNGTRFALFNAGGDVFTGALSQPFTTVIGQAYTVSVDVGIVGATGKKQRLGVIVNGTAPNLVASVPEVSGPTNWATFTYTFTADSTSTTILLSDQSAGLTLSQRTSADLLVDQVSVTAVGGGNTAPVAVADAYSTNEDTPLTIASGTGLLLNDTDAQSNPLTAIKVTDPANGSVTVNTNGSFTYTPNANFNGTDTFTYKANDLLLDSNVATVTLTVVAVNDVPVAAADSYTATQNVPLVVAAPGLLTNDTDVENSALTAIKVTDPSNGTVTVTSLGGFTYTPTTGYTGPDSFTYKANDGTSDSTPVTVSLTVQAPGPVGLVNGSFEAGTPQNVGPLDNWTITGTSGPSGTAPFAPFGYLNSAPFYVPRDGNRLVVFNAGSNTFDGKVAQTFGTVPGQSYEVRFSAAIYNASGTTAPTGRTQKVRMIVKGLGGATLISVTEDVAGPRNVTTWREDILHTFTADSASTEISFDDGPTLAGTSATQATTSDLLLDHVRVTAAGSGNTAPVAVADAYSTNEDTPLTIAAGAGLLFNDTDAQSNPLTAIKVTDPANGSVTVNTNGSFTYTPNANFNGTDSFTYKANDLLLDSNIATVTLTVVAVNDLPVAVADSYTATQNVPLVVAAPGLLTNDTDVENSALTAIKVTNPTNGSVTVNTDGGFTYTPNSGYTGPDSFTYKANDGTGDSTPATVSLTVQVPAPVGLVNGSFEAGIPQNVGPLDNWTITGTSGPSGTAPFAPFGYLTSAPFYVPRDGNRLVVFNAGSNTFDGKVAQTFGTVPGQSYEVRFSAAIYNAAGTTAPTGRTQKVRMTIKGNGGATLFTVTEDVAGVRNATTWRENILHTFTADSASTEISFDDGPTLAGTSATQATTSDLLLDHVRVTAAGSGNTAPVAVADAYSTNEDTALTIAAGAGLLFNDTDAQSNPLTAIKVTDPANGSVTVNTNGSFTYTPNANFNGTDTFTYKANDLLLDSNIATVTLTVVAVNDLPVATADSYTATQDVPLVVAAPGLLSNDTDVENSALTAIKVTDPTNGSVTVNTNGGFTYTPNSGYTGPDSFTYKANDATGDSTPATVSLTVQVPAPVGLVNGSFEAGTPQNVGPLDNWTITGASGPSGTAPFAPFGYLTSAPFYVPRDGNRLVVFNAGSNTFDGKVAQTFGTVPGQSYEVRFSAAIYNAAGTTAPTGRTQKVRMIIKGNGGATLFTVTEDVAGPRNTTTWRENILHTFTADSATTEISFDDNQTLAGTAATQATSSDLLLDHVRVTAAGSSNTAPVAVADAYSTNEDTPLTIAVGAGLLFNDTDAQSNPLTAIKVTDPANGSVTVNTNGSFTYTPNANFNGTDTFTYKANDLLLDSNIATVTLTVVAVNDLPVATADSYTATQNVPLVVAAPGLLSNDTDVENSTLTAIKVTNPTSGSVTVNTDGGFTYTPNSGYAGPDSFTYKANDATGDSTPGTVSITVEAPVGNVLLNGSFELGPITNVPFTGATTINSWILGGTGTRTGYVADSTWGASDLTRLVIFNAGGDSFGGQISQTFNTVVGQLYRLSLDYGIYSPSNGKSQRIGIVVAGVSPSLVQTFRDISSVANTSRYLSESFQFTADSTSTTLTLADLSGALSASARTGGDLILDNVKVEPVITRTLTVNSTPVAGIAIGVAPNDLSANSNGTTSFTRSYINDTSVTLTAPASSGTRLFSKWQRNGVDLATTPTAVTVLNGNQTLTAVYVQSTIPIAAGDSYTTNEDTELVVAAPGVLTNDLDPNSISLTAEVVTPPATGTLNFNTNGGFSYTPVADASGSISFTYRATNGTQFSTPVTVNITVSPVNDLPVASGQTLSTNEDTALPIVLVATDADGDTVTYLLASPPTNGVLSGTGADRTYTPNANYSGPDSFSFAAEDGTGTSAPATISISVISVPEAPVANAQAVSLRAGTSVPIVLTGSDGDGDAITYSIVSSPTQGALSGTLPNLTYIPVETYVGSDSFTFTVSDGTSTSAPATVSITVDSHILNPSFELRSGTSPNFTPDSWTATGNYQIKSDPVTPRPGNGTWQVAFNAANTAPNGVLSQAFPTVANRPHKIRFDIGIQTFVASSRQLKVRVRLFAGAVVHFNQEVTITRTGNTTTGVVGWDLDKEFTFTPTTTNTTLEITDTSTTTAANGTDLLFDNVRILPQITRQLDVVSSPNTGVAATVTPNDISAAGNGVTTFTRRYLDAANVTLSVPAVSGAFNFQKWRKNGVDDGTNPTGKVVAMTANIVMTAVYLPNAPPVTGPDSYTTNEDVPLVVSAANGVLGNDSDPEAVAITALIDTQPASGSVVLNANGGFTYTPAANFFGTDTFTYVARDGVVNSAPTTVTITVTSVNDLPVANAQTLSVVEDTPLPVTLTGSDLESTELVYSVVDGPANGALSGTAPALTYTPNTNFAGSDSFTFKVNDGTADSSVTIISITVTPVNDAPVATAQSLTTDEDTALPITLSGMDVENSSLTATVVVGPTNGTLSGISPALTYTPALNFSGTDSFTFKVNDGTDDSTTTATISITVTAVNDLPVATAQSLTTVEDTALPVTLAGTDVESASVTATVVADPSNGTLSGTSPNLTYTPAANFTGTDSFTFKVNDGTDDSTTATISITVTAVNDVPVATAQSLTTNEDTALPIPLSGTDVENSSLTATVVDSPTNGTLSGTSPDLTYTPAANFSGTDSFTFKVNDGTDDSTTTATISITVTAVNDVPVATAQSLTTAEDTALPITLAGTDVENSSLTATVVDSPTNGTLSGTSPALTYTPALNFSGTDSFTFKVNDGTDDSTTATISITVTAVNDLPVASAQSVSVNEDDTLAINLVASDADADSLTYSVGTPANGTLTGTAPSLTYTPTSNYSGPDSFTFKVNDGTGDSNVAVVTIDVVVVDDAPVANAQSLTVAEDMDLPIVLSGSDAESPSVTTQVVTQPLAGTLTGTPPNLIYSPDADFVGTDSFTFKVNDGTLDSIVATIEIEVTSVNDAPIAIGDEVDVVEDTPTNIPLMVDDVDGDVLVFTVSGPTNGTLSGVAPALVYTPNLNFSGADSFTFSANDGEFSSSTVTVVINVSSEDDAPVATAQSLTTPEDTALPITLAGTDAESASVTASVLTGPSNGSLSGTVPNLTYTPASNFSGTDSFTFKVNDGALDSAAATISITVLPLNDAPVALGQSVAVNEDTPKAINLVATDVDEDALTYIVGTPDHGTLSGTAPALTYTPDENYTGSDSFTFKVNDGTVLSAEVTVTIEVAPVDDLPIATAQSLTVVEDTTLNITLSGTDEESPSVSSIVLSNPASGTLSGVAPDIIYTPNLNFTGTDSFTFRVNDGAQDSEAATITVNVTAVNDIPVATAQSLTTAEDTALPITLSGTDVENSSLTATVMDSPSNGTLSGTSPDLTYTPASNFSGTDSFTFKVNDGTVDSTTATISITVTAVNDLPVATAQSLTTVEDTALPVVLAGTDLESASVTATVVADPTNGTLSGTSPDLTYTPAVNFTGTDSFTFKVNDGTDDSTTATISITVTAVNDLPVATAQSLTTAEDTALPITLAGTDVESASVTATVVADPSNGTLSGTSPDLTYTPAANFTGTDSFTFKVNDGTDDSATATISITVTAVNDVPVATAQSLTTNEDTALPITLAGTDVESASVTATVVADPTNGTLSGTSPDLTYTPAANFSGTDSFTFKVNDGTDDSTTATISITVTAVNDLPVATAQSLTTVEDTALPIALAGTDLESASVTATVVAGPSSGTLSGTAPDLTYTPAANFTGTDSFTFKVNDGTDDSTTATISITVTAVNDAPVATAQSLTTNEDTALPITLSGTDVENSSLTATVVVGPTNGTLNGTSPALTYTPAANFSGTDSFTFKVNDGTDDSTTATISITVTAVNDLPVATAQSLTTVEDTALPVTLAGMDVESASVTATVVVGPTNGTLSGIAPDLTYTPAANFTGTASFTFKVNDGTEDSAIATISITVTAVNDAPVATAQSLTTAEDTALPIALAGTDVDNSSLTAMLVTDPSNGTLSGTSPALTYTPAANFSGTDSFTFKVNDGTDDSTTATISITVTAVNDLPVATEQTLTTAEDTALPITLGGTDVESASVTATVVAGPTNGTLSGTAPDLTYTPAANFSGTDSFTFSVNDGTDDSATATISITVTAVNDAPVATAQSLTTNEDTALPITLAGTDVENSSLTAMVVTVPTSGALSGTLPNLTYTPALNFTGTDSFTFKVNDGTDDSTLAMISITVTSVNDAPVATAQSLTTDEDTALPITLGGTDVENSSLLATVVAVPSNGSLSGIPPNLTYTPALNFTGADSFTFSVNDGTADSTTATISITVTPVNDVPVATAQSLTTAEDTALPVILSGTDVENSTLSATVEVGPSNGALSGTSPNLTYTPAANFNGADSFTFKVNDGTADSTVKTISITVTAVNDLPVATAQSLTTNEDTALPITLAGTDVESASLLATVVAVPSNGSLSGIPPNLTYTPALNFTGADSFTFSVNDGTVDSTTATISITVTAVNDVPVATAQSLTTAEDTALPITLAGTDVESASVTATVVVGPTNGTLSGTSPALTYTPAANFSGTDSFTFKVNDGTDDSTTATISITVTAVNDLPLATAQSLTTAEDTALPITLAGTDVESASVTATVVAGPSNGALSGTSPAMTYTPALNFSGTDSFTFKVNDGTDDSTTATISITVTAVNDAPVATAQSLTTNEDTALPITLAGTDVENSSLLATVVVGPTNGTLSGTSPALTYTPAANFSGTDSFTFKVNDGTDDSTTATISITVTAVNDLPLATAQSLTTAEDTALPIILAGTDVESASLLATVVAGPSNGTLSGTLPALTYTPAANFSGTDSFTFSVNDGTDDSSIAMISITVTAVNDAPVATAQSLTTAEDTALPVTLAGTDVESSSLTAMVVDSPLNGTLSGTVPDLTYTPAVNFSGTDSFTFKVNDGTADSSTAMISITVTAVNDAPVATAQSLTTAEDTALPIILAGTDVENSSLTAMVVNGPLNGTLSGTAPNLTYTPFVGYFGPDSFGFTVSDGTSTSSVATVSITVTEAVDAGFLAWLAEYGLVAGPNTDSDNDLIKNSVEYVIGGNPANQNNTNLLPVSTLVTADPDNNSVSDPYLMFTYRRTDRANNDPLTTIRVEWNPSLFGAWTNSAGTPGVVTTVENDHYAAGVDRVRVYLPRSLSSGGMLFARLAVFINVGLANEAPVATPQTVSVNEDASKPIVLAATDLNADALTYTVLTQPANGSLSGLAPNLTYTPNPNFNGQDSFTFKANDGTVDSAPATVSITVNPLEEINQWLAGFGVTGGINDDSDGDSISNMIEWVIGGNPANQPNLAMLPTSSLVIADLDNNSIPEQYLLFTYRRTDLAKNDPSTVIRVQWDTDMAGVWTNASGTLGVSTFVDDDHHGLGIDRVRVYIPRSLSVSGALFARFAVVVNQP